MRGSWPEPWLNNSYDRIRPPHGCACPVCELVVQMVVGVPIPGRSPSVSPCTASSGEEPGKAEPSKKEAAKKPGSRPAKAAAKQKQPKKDAKEEEKEVAADGSEKMRAALQALKQRRADLDAAHQELDASKSQIEELRQQLKSARADLESERETKASATEQMESALQRLTSELQATELAKASLASETAILRTKETERLSEIHQLQKACAETKVVQSELGHVRSQLERALQEKSAAVKDAEALQVRTSTLGRDLEALKKSQSSLTTEITQLKAALGDAKSKASDADLEIRALRKDVEDARRAQAHAEEIVRRGPSAAEARRAGFAVDSARAEVEAAWSLVGPGLDRLQQALFAAGLLQACRPADKCGAGDPAARQDASAAKKPKREREEKGDRGGKKDKKDDTVKKSKRDKKGKKDRRKEAEEGKDVEDPRASRRVPELSGSSSSDVEVGQLVGTAGPSILRSGPRPKGGSRNVNFSIANQVDVVSYRACGEHLWFPNPQSNVLCERCKRRVPQRLGQLRGGNGKSSFMCDEFFCDDCSAKLTLST
ncbi:unnamed protein product [Symbiodinium sp. CCMP2456]|nr:unnamed protein product [Symbiodinium sp. CCMP2456]